MVGEVSVGGSVEVGKNVWIGPRSIIVNRITIEDNAKILIGSVVIMNVKAGEEISGNFALSHHKNLVEWMRKNK